MKRHAVQLAQLAARLRPADVNAMLALMDAEVNTGNVEGAKDCATKAAAIDAALNLPLLLSRLDSVYARAKARTKKPAKHSSAALAANSATV